MRLIILSLFIMASTILPAQEVYLFAGTYTKGKSEGIYVYKFDTVSGEVKPVSTTFTENPSYLALSPDKKFVYAVTENGNNKGAVSSFSFDQSTGKLKLINTKLSNG